MSRFFRPNGPLAGTIGTALPLEFFLTSGDAIAGNDIQWRVEPVGAADLAQAMTTTTAPVQVARPAVGTYPQIVVSNTATPRIAGACEVVVSEGGTDLARITINVAAAAPAPPPTAVAITTVNPNTGWTGDHITLTGTMFTGATGVELDGVSATNFVVVSPTTITCDVPAHTAGPVNVRLCHPTGNISVVDGFTYVDPNPAPPPPGGGGTNAAITPTAGPLAGNITITGDLNGTLIIGHNGQGTATQTHPTPPAPVTPVAPAPLAPPPAPPPPPTIPWYRSSPFWMAVVAGLMGLAIIVGCIWAVKSSLKAPAPGPTAAEMAAEMQKLMPPKDEKKKEEPPPPPPATPVPVTLRVEGPSKPIDVNVKVVIDHRGSGTVTAGPCTDPRCL
ncbi:IPT/TIG domain-containing protein [Candidatus Uhrbacteria bacterium]|nr:IPT/TIG domain-containing protein [Candidatus Uhrbacteria bacterium]